MRRRKRRRSSNSTTRHEYELRASHYCVRMKYIMISNCTTVVAAGLQSVVFLEIDPLGSSCCVCLVGKPPVAVVPHGRGGTGGAEPEPDGIPVS